MKRSEVIRIMREVIEEVPSAFIDLKYFRSWRAPNGNTYAVHFYSKDDCGSHGCIFGWSALAKPLAPRPSDFSPYNGVLIWGEYTCRIFGLKPCESWNNYQLFTWLFNDNQYPTSNDSAQRKAEIIRRLGIAEEALRKCNEDIVMAYNNRFNHLGTGR